MVESTQQDGPGGWQMPDPATELYIPQSLLDMTLEDPDTFLRTSKGDYQRICFGNLPLTDMERDHWLAF